MASVNKRTRLKADGSNGDRWTVRWFDETGTRRSKGFDTKKQADAHMRKVERELEDGTHVADANADTVGEIGKQFLLNAEQRWKDGRIGRSRYERLRLVVEGNLTPLLGGVRFRDLTAEKVEGAYRCMVRDGLAPSTARDRVQDFKLVEGFARRRGHLKTQPVADAAADLRGIKRKRIRTFTADEAGRLLRVAGSHRPCAKVRASAMLNVFVHLGMFCGLRLGEIYGLTIANVDPDARLLRIRHSLTCFDELKGPKTAAGVRDVPLPAHLWTLINEWMATHHIAEPRGLIFRTATGGRIDNGNVHYSWRALLKAASLDHDKEPFHFHALRHFAASWMIENRLPLTDVAALLGHSKFDMTLQVYAHSVTRPAMRHDAMERMVSTLPAPPSDPNITVR